MSTRITSILFEGREWFDRSGGNSYHSVRVWVNGQVVAQVGFSYGYGDAYIFTGLDELRAAGLVESGASVRDIEGAGVAVYTVKCEALKRELFKNSGAGDFDERMAKLAPIVTP